MEPKLINVLLIDDDEDDNFFHQRVIRASKACDGVHVSETATRALEFLKTNTLPNLIFLDINMPRMNGWEFLHEFKKQFGENTGTIIVMLTTSLNPADKEKAKGIPIVSGFLTKPLTKDLFSDILKQYFNL